MKSYSTVPGCGTYVLVFAICLPLLLLFNWGMSALGLGRNTTLGLLLLIPVVFVIAARSKR